jgi:hypothetical protein
MDALLTYRFNRLSGSEANTFNLQSQLLRDEVELGGETQVGKTLIDSGHSTAALLIGRIVQAATQSAEQNAFPS